VASDVGCADPRDPANIIPEPAQPPGLPSADEGLAEECEGDAVRAGPGELRWTIRRSGRRVGRGAAVGSAGTVGQVRIATWNVNSVRQRVPRLLPWLDERRPDVVCLQETKLADDAFLDLLGDEFGDRGYAVAVHGEATWNGVAILSRVGLDEVVVGLAGAPGFPRPESRAVSATCGGIRVVSVYVPNGRVPDSEHYQYKLAWLASLRELVAAGAEATVVCGDMNIAPTDDDVFDPEAYVGQTHVTPPRAGGPGGAPGARLA
jgi:Endonuclease/Exonuclease/phosphatase family